MSEDETIIKYKFCVLCFKPKKEGLNKHCKQCIRELYKLSEIGFIFRGFDIN